MSDRFSDITDLSELPPSTTTISTVAVQSGRSKVILAILRGAEWIRVRVHQMEPDLTDVGSTLEEALQLRHEHHEMLAKLKSKEDEIKNILASADAYATENRSQADVYAAMAETLNEAWRELNTKLDHRSMLLDQSVAFHQSAQDFASKMEQAQGKVTAMLPTQDVNTARHLLQQHQDIKKSILESSQLTLQQGNSLLERIREMGMHADLQNRHATTAACYGIEHLLELLQDRRRRLEEIWEQRRIRLEQCLELCQLDQEVNKVLEWYRSKGSVYLQRTELGDSYQHSQLIQEEHYRFESQARQIQENVLRLVRRADQLLRRTNLDAEGVRHRLQIVDQECENFMVRLDTRRKNITMALSFFDLAEAALTKLDQTEVQLNTMDLPRNSAELADRHSQLSNVIVEVSTPALREGRLLLERVSRDDLGADGVRRKMTQLQDRCSGLESLCKARRAEAWERSQTYLIFQERYTSLHTWLTQIGQATLSRHSDMGTSLTNAEDFLEVHEQLEQDIRDKNADMEALSEAGVNLVKSGDQEAQSAAEKVDTLCKHVQRLHSIVEIRIRISIVYVTFHKLVQQLSNSMNGLEHIIKSETENLQDLTENAVKHTTELWNKVSETYNQLMDKGQNFIQISSTVQDDSTIKMKNATTTVERYTAEYSERMTILSTTYESWSTHVSSSRQFKTQWHQFVQDARKTINWVMKIENDFFPVIAGDLGTSVETANRYQSQLEEFIPQFKKAQEEIEKHLSTAELLSLKGDTKGQKDQIVNELIKVHQRFTARIHEYQILLKMTIQFFRNLDQLDRLIEKTEKEYMESELPSELSQAESLLEEHKRKKQEVSSLINYTADEGEKIVVRVRQTDAEAAAQDDVERVLKVTAEYKQRWNQAWEEQEKRLKQNLQICQFNYDLRQIHSEIDELHQHLQARRGSYGNSLPAAKMNSQAYKQFEMTVELIEKKIHNFTSTAELMVQERHDDAVHIDRELDLLNTKWTTFHTSVNNYRHLLDNSITFYSLYEDCETWIKEGNTFLNSIAKNINECRSAQDAERLISSLEKFIESGRPNQESRLQKMSELVIELYGEEGPSRLHNLFVQNQEMMQSFQQAENHISQVKSHLQERESAQPVVEEIQPMEVTVTASMPAKKPPQIILQLKDAEVMEGEKVTLECHVDSATVPEVMWYKDNMPLNSPDYETRYNRGIATLTIEETFSEDTARYTCRLTNDSGTAESSAYLHVRETHQQIIPPDFTKNLKSVDVLENSPFSMECHVTGIPSPTISWYRDDQSIDSSPEYIITKINGTCCLKIRQALRHHSARYTCQANNPGGEAASSARITVVPMEIPVIHKMSEDIVIPEGKGVKLEVMFSGSPTPDVTWYRGQDRIVPSSVYKITIDINRCLLEIKEAYPEDSGTYTVVLQNAAGETRRSCQVSVESFYSSTTESMSQASTEIEAAKPNFLQHLSPTKEVMEGSRVRLDCLLVGHPEPEVIWIKNDKPVKESKDIQLLFEGDRCTLCIREAYLEDSGVYCIVAKNTHGQAESLCKLHVEPLSELSDASVGEMTSPRFSQPLRDFSVQSGHRVCLQCRITGHPVPEAKWYKDNRAIDSGPDFEITAFHDVHNLTIPEAFEEDSGTYMVKAVNMAGEAKCYCKLTVKTMSEPMEAEEVMRMKRVVETKEMKMKVRREELDQSPPEFQRLFQDQNVNAGDCVTLECSITGSPKPKVTWFFNGQPVVSRDYQITMEGNIHRLHIPEVFDEDAGRFSITAENPSGKATCSAVLNVDEEPTVPKTRIFGSTEYTSRRVSHTETVTSTETRLSRTILTSQQQQQPSFIPSAEQHSTTIVTDVKPQYETPKLTAHEHYATTITTDLQPKFQPVDLTIAVPVPPKFVQALKNITSSEGSKVTFEGVVTGKPEPTIKWYRESRELTDQADFEISYKDGRVSLTIPEVFQEDAGQFMCTARNVAGSASSTAELIIKASVIPPSFIEKVQTQDVIEGAPVRFTVRVAGQPTPEVTWFKDGTKLTSSRDFEIVQEGDIHSLYIPEVFYEDAGKISVTAQNPAGKTQCQGELRIQTPMEESVTPVIKPVTHVKPPFERLEEPMESPRLQRPSDFIKRDVSPRTHSPAQKFTEHVDMEIAGDKDLPVYEQRFTLFKKPEETAPPKSVSEVSYKPVISHKQPPKFTKPLKDKTIKEGEKLVLEVHVEYRGPEPIVKWYREGLIIRNSPDYQITFDKGTSTLSVAEVFPEDTGVYKCIATNADGSDTTEAMLRVIAASLSQYEQMPVQEKPDYATHVPMEEEKVPSQTEPEQPVFVESPQNYRLVEGTNAIFECRIAGRPFPEITWRRRGFPVRNDARHRISIDEFTGRCSLVISNCKPDDAGDYTCTAINFAGEANSTATLLPAEVKPSPPAPPPPELPKTQPPWHPTKPSWQQKAEAPPSQKSWQQKQQAPWTSVTEQFTRAEAPHKPEKGFITTRSERILESNLEYRRSQEPEEKSFTSSAEFRPAPFETRLLEQNYLKDGRIKFSSETETSQSEYESEIDRSPVSQPTPPQISQRLKDFRLMEGSDATFVCKISGRPRPKVAWYLNGHRIKRSNRYEMKYTKDGYCTLRIRMALPEDAGHYTVLAVNSAGKDTCSSKLFVDRLGNIDATSFVAPETLDKILNKDRKDTVPEDEGGILEALSRPVFKKTPEDREVHEGNTVRLDTLVSGRPVPELTWFINERPVHNDDHHKIVVNEDGVNSLIILGASRYDGGIYTCVAKNKAGENSFSVKLTVMEKERMQPPKFVERMQNYTIKEGHPVTLTCQAVGVPTPMVSWQKDGKMLTPNRPYQIQTEGGRTSLIIPATQVSDSAWYQCSAANVAGTASTRAKINVQAEPKKIEPKKKFSITKAPKRVPSPPTATEPIVSRTDSPPHYEIQPEGLVQQISYSTERESGILRFVKEEDISRLGQRPIDQVSPKKIPLPKMPQAPPMAPPTEEQPMEEDEILPKSVAEAKARFQPDEEMPQAKQPKHKKPSKPPQQEALKYKFVPPPPEQPAHMPQAVVPPAPPKPQKEPLKYKFVPPPQEKPHVPPVVGPVHPPKPEQKEPLKYKFVPPPQEQPMYVPQVAAPPPPIVPVVQKKKVKISDKKHVKPPSPPGYEIQEEGFVQQISYASDTETGYLRLVSEDEVDMPRREPLERAERPVPDAEEEQRPVSVPRQVVTPPIVPAPRQVVPTPPSPSTVPPLSISLTSKAKVKTQKFVSLQPPPVAPKPKRRNQVEIFVSGVESAPESHYEIREVGPVQEIHYVSDTEAGVLRLVGYSTEEEPERYEQDFIQPYRQPEISLAQQAKHKQYRSVKPPSPKGRKKPKKEKTPSPPKETVKPMFTPPKFEPKPVPVAPKPAPVSPPKFVAAPPQVPQNMKVKSQKEFRPSKPDIKPKPSHITRKFDMDIPPKPDVVSAEAKFFQRKPTELDVEMESNVKPSQLAQYKLTGKFETEISSDVPDFNKSYVTLDGKFYEGSPVDKDLGVHDINLRPSDIVKHTVTHEISKKFGTEVDAQIPAAQKADYISAEYKTMDRGPVDVDLGVDQSGLQPADISRKTYTQVSKKYQTSLKEDVPAAQRPDYVSVQLTSAGRGPIDVDLGVDQSGLEPADITKKTFSEISKKFQTGLREDIPAIQQPDFVSAEAKFFQRAPVSEDLDVEESNLKPSEIALLRKKQMLAKRYPSDTLPKPKPFTKETISKDVPLYSDLPKPLLESMKLMKPAGFSSVAAPKPIQKSAIQKYFSDDELSVSAVTFDARLPPTPAPAVTCDTRRPPIPAPAVTYDARRPPIPAPKSKKQTQKSHAKVKFQPVTPHKKEEKPKPKRTEAPEKPPKPKKPTVKSEHRVTFAPDTKQKYKSESDTTIKYRSDSDTLFTESDSDAPDWAYVGSRVIKKRPSDKPKKLVIDIQPLKLQPTLYESREPVRAPDVPKPVAAYTTADDYETWVPDSSIIPQVASDIERKEQELRDLYRESAVREFIRREGQAPAEEDLYHKDKHMPPKFKTHVKNLTKLNENDAAHFECKLMPYGDPTMKVEWYKDGQPLHHGHRFKPMFEFGFVTLDILYTYPEDSGVYECRASNSFGTDVTQATVRCRGQQSIIAETQLPGEGALRLQEMEDNWRKPAHLDDRQVDEPKVKHPPSIDLKPEPVEVSEGEPAKFMVKVSGHPRPRVTWWVNGTMIMTSTRFKIRYDGMMNYMDIPRVREYDTGQIRVVAKNTEGEAEASTVLNVVPKEDWRSQLRQAPKGELEIELDRRRKIELKSVEFKKPTDRPRAADYELKQIERAHETRIKMKHDKELFMKTDSKFTTHVKVDQPARVVRPDRPEIQMEIQKARMIPVIPEQIVPTDESKVSETQIVLERREPPVFVKPLRPSRITEGNPVTLEVHFKGYPPPIISWYRDSFEIHPSHDFQITTTETTSTMHIPEVFPEDTGMFMVKAYNMYGTVQCKAKLTVVEEEETERVNSPEFRNLIHDTNISEGEPATFDCQVTGRPKPSVQWMKDGKPLEESARWKFIEEEDNYTLLIFEVTPEDAGHYDCVALNTVGKATCTARLNVEVPVKPPETLEPLAEAPVEAPVVTSEPQNLIVDEGEPVTFTCKIRGSPAPVVNWYRNNQLIKPSKYFRMESSPDGTHSLSILEAFPEDSGNYRCVARNKAGEVTCSAILKVNGLESDAEPPSIESRTQPPSFNQPITNTLVVEGSTATFEAKFTGTPQPEITWLRNGLQVIQDSRNYKIQRNPTSTILTIKQAFPEDSGLITCRIKNISGSTECSAELYVQDLEEARLLEEKYITTIKTNPPEFIKALSPVREAKPGHDARLEARVSAYPPPRFNWYFSGKEIIPSDHRQVKQDKDTIILIIRKVRPEDQGDYTLKVQNEMGEITCRTTLTIEGKEKIVALPYTDTTEQTMTVTETTTTITREEHLVSQLVKPEFTEPLEPEIYVRERGIARLECKIDAYPPPLVTWFINGMEVHPSPHYEVLYEDGKSILLIIEVGPEDVGEYTCRAVSELGEVVSSTTLYVQEPATEEMAPVQRRPEDVVVLQPSPSEFLQPPRFVEPLQSMEVVDGEEFNLPCKVTGKPPPQISFFHNGKNIDHDEEYVISYNPETGELNLLIVEVFPEDEGEYVCVAHNPAGEASTRMYLSVLEGAPLEEDAFEETPMEVDQTEVSFSIPLPQEGMEITEEAVIPKVIERPKVEPLEKTAPRSPSPEPVYPVTEPVDKVQLPEEPMEEVLEDVLEPEVKPKVIDRPKVKSIVQEKAPEESPEREVAVIIAESKMPPEETKPEVSEESVVPEIVTKKIKLPQEKPVDERVGKEDSIPGEEPSARKPEIVAQYDTVLVPETTEEMPPEFVELLQPQILPDGDEVHMSCRVEGTPTPVIKWYKDGQELVPSTDFKIDYDENTGVCSLVIPEVFPEDAGEYSCRAENMFGDSVTSASLIVHTMPDDDTTPQTRPKPTDMPDSAMEIDQQFITRVDIPPQFVKPLESEVIVKEGGSATLEVQVSGEPQPKVTWYKNEVQIVPDNRTMIVPEKNTTKLIIDHIQPEDDAEYICVAENDRGVVTCKTTLHVLPIRRVEFEIPEEKPERIRDQTVPKYAVSEDETAPSASEDEMPEDKIVPPEFTELLQPATVRDGERLVLKVHFRGFPVPKIRWYHEGKEIQSSADFQITTDYNVGESTLIIIEVFPEDQGEYTCTAKNKHGETITTCRLTVVSSDEEIPSKEFSRTTIEVQQMSQPQVQKVPVQEIHTTKMNIEELPVEEQPFSIPETTKFSEMIELDHKPKVSEPFEIIPIQQERQQKGPVQVEIQIGVPTTTMQTTTSVLTETTTYTQVMSELKEEPVPEITEGDEVHKTTMIMKKEEQLGPMEFKLQLPQKETTEIVTDTHQLVTEERKFTEMPSVEGPSEQHKETIEILHEGAPQEVELRVELPTKETTRTEITTTTTEERRQSIQKMDIEIKEAYMKQKPKQTEIVIPLKEETVDTEVKDMPRPTEERVEVVRHTIEKERVQETEKPTSEVDETAMSFVADETTDTEVKTTDVTETSFTMVIDQSHIPEEKLPTDTKTDEVTQEIIEDTQVSFTLQPVAETVESKDIKDLQPESAQEMPESETFAPQEEIHISERGTLEIVKEPTEMEGIEIDIDISDRVPEVTEVKSVEKVTETVSSEVEFQLPQSQETHMDEITLDIKEKPMEEVQLVISMDQPEKQVPIQQEITDLETVKRTEKETVELPMLEKSKPAEIVLQTEERPGEDIELSFQLQEQTVTETEEHKTSETLESVESEFTFQVPQSEETRSEKIIYEVEEKPSGGVEMTFQIPTEQSVPETEEIIIREKEIQKSQEIVEVPETSQIETENIVIDVHDRPSEAVEMTIEIDTEKSVPVTEEKTYSEEITKITTEEREIPQISETFTDQISFQVDDQPSESAEITFQIDTDKDVTLAEETKQLPLTKESTEQEFTISVENQPAEEAEFTFQIDEREVPETTQTLVMEKHEEIHDDQKVPESVTQEEVTFQVGEQPIEDYEMTVQIGQDDEQTVTEESKAATVMGITESFTFQVPESEDTKTEEITFQIQEEPIQDVTETEKTDTSTTHVENVTESFTFQVPESEGTQAQEITFQMDEQPMEDIQQTTDTETSTTTRVEKITESFTFQVPESEDIKVEESTFQIDEQPSQDVEMTIQVHAEESSPEKIDTMDVVESTTTETEIFFDAQETQMEEVTIEIDKPKKGVELTLKMPESSDKKIIVTEEQTTLRESFTTREVFDVHIPEGHSAPTFTWGLTSLKVMDGEEVKFRCEVTAEPMPEISWFHDDKPITENQDFKLTYDLESGACTLLIVEVFPQDAGEYRCEALNPYGKAVTRGFLEVESYEYVPDTEEASDSMMSSLDTASPRPIESDSEVSTIRKEIMEEFKKMQEKMEIDVDDIKEEIDEVKELDLEEIRPSEIETKLEKPEMQKSEFKSQPIQETPAEMPLTDIDVVKEDTTTSTEISKDAIKPDVKTTEESKVSLAEIVTEKPEITELPLRIPEETQEKTEDVEKLQPFAKSPVESVTSLSTDAVSISEVEKIPEDEVDHVILKQTEISEQKMDVEKPTTSKTSEEKEEISMITVSDVEKPDVQTTEQTEISLALQKPDQDTLTTKTELVTSEEDQPELSDIVKPESDESTVSQVEIQFGEITKKDIISETKLLTEEVSESHITDVSKPIMEEKQPVEVEIQIQIPSKDTVLTETTVMTDQKEISQTSDISVLHHEETKLPTEVEIQLQIPSKEAVLSETIVITDKKETPQITTISDLQPEETKQPTEVEVQLDIPSKESVLSKTSVLLEKPETSEISEISQDVPESTQQITEHEIEYQTPSKETTLSEIKPVSETKEIPEITEISKLQPEITDVTEEKHDIQKPETEILETIEAPEKESPVEVVPEEAPLQPEESEQREKHVQEEITITVTPAEQDRQEATIFVSTAEHEAPKFVIPLTDVTVMENTTLKLEVMFSGSPTISVTWRLDGEEITPSEDVDIIVEEFRSVLVIHQVFPEDEGEYWVECVNKEGKAKSAGYLTVLPLEGEKMQKRPEEEQPAKQDELSTATVEIADMPEAVKLNIEIEESVTETSETFVQISKDQEITKPKESTLQLTISSAPKLEVAEEDKLEETPIPQKSEIDITVKEEGVSEAPRFTKTLQRQIDVIEGTSVTIECVACGKPLPVITWYQDDEPITTDEHFITEYHQGICRLTIQNVFLEDEAEYKCEARNDHGVVTTITEIFVEKSNADASDCVLLHEEIIKIEVNVEFHWTKATGNSLNSEKKKLTLC